MSISPVEYSASLRIGAVEYRRTERISSDK